MAIKSTLHWQMCHTILLRVSYPSPGDAFCIFYVPPTGISILLSTRRPVKPVCFLWNNVLWDFNLGRCWAKKKLHTHTHTHTHIYIYIEREREREKERERERDTHTHNEGTLYLFRCGFSINEVVYDNGFQTFWSKDPFLFQGLFHWPRINKSEIL